MHNPRRGELYWVDFSPGRGSEHLGIRPALIIQNDIGNERGSTTIVAAVSTTVRAMPLHVAIAAADVSRSGGDRGLPAASQIKLEQLQTIDKQRLGRRIGTLSETKLHEVDLALRISLALA